MTALKQWNAKNESWCIPRKGTEEHAEVLKIMKAPEVEKKPLKKLKLKKDAKVELSPDIKKIDELLALDDPTKVTFEQEREAQTLMRKFVEDNAENLEKMRKKLEGKTCQRVMGSGKVCGRPYGLVNKFGTFGCMSVNSHRNDIVYGMKALRELKLEEQ
jgi:hypothetical protein